jgi:hypothetical protein
MSNIGKIEYRVRETTRYIITRYHEDASGADASVDTKGEYENADVAYEVAYALCKQEHERFGFAPGDERIVYPRHPNDANAYPCIAAAAPKLGGKMKMMSGRLGR